jgi:biopolymer transport protein ExbD
VKAALSQNVAAALAALLLAGPIAAQTPEPLRIVVVDGQVLFAGANLDIDELRAALVKSGRQDETLMFQVGPNAKSGYISQVLKAVKDAGFTKFSIVGPTNGRPVLTVDPAQKLD